MRLWMINMFENRKGKEKAILSLSNVGKDDIRTYRCEAKSGIEEAKNKTSFELIVHCKCDELTHVRLASVQALWYVCSTLVESC